jgi:uncharacterized protein (TIGR03382 family)
VNASNSLGPAPEHYVTGAPFPGSGMAYHMAGGFHTEYNDDDNNGTFRAGGPNPESTAGTYNISTSYRDNLRMGDPDGDGNFNGGPDRTHPTVESVGGVLYRSFWMQLTEPVAKADRITGNSDLDESGSDYAFVIHNDGEGAGDQGNYTGQIAVTHSRQGTAPPPGDNGWFTYPYVLSLRANDPTGSSDKIVNVEAAPFVVGDWHHFVVGYEPNKTKVWFDGNLVMDDATLGTYDPGKGRNEEIEGELRMNNVAWSFAAKKESGDFLIDDLAFFQEPLTDAHVQAIYTQGVAGAIPEPGTALMALVGLVGLLGLSRRRRDG